MKKVASGIVLGLMLTMGTGIVGAQELPNEVPSQEYNCEAIFVKADSVKSKIDKSLERLEESNLVKRQLSEDKLKDKADKLGITVEDLKAKYEGKKAKLKEEYEASGLTKEEFREKKAKEFEAKKDEFIKKKAKELGITEEELRAKIEAQKEKFKKEFEESGLSKKEFIKMKKEEFRTKKDEMMKEKAKELGISVDELKQKIKGQK